MRTHCRKYKSRLINWTAVWYAAASARGTDSGGNALTAGEIELFAVHSARVCNWLNKCFAGCFHGNQRTCTLHYANGGLRSDAELFISVPVHHANKHLHLFSNLLPSPPSGCRTRARNIQYAYIGGPQLRVRWSPESSTLRLIPLNPSAHP
jgi:hypothetical protein